MDVSAASIVKHFESLPDPRHERNRKHLLVHVIVICVCGVLGIGGLLGLGGQPRAPSHIRPA